jgi:hypothetical protein
MHITPLVAQALVACATSPDQRLRRTRGGYVASGTKTPIFTKRLLQMMDRAWLVQLEGDYSESARLTPKGQAEAARLLGAGKAVAA